MLLNEVEVCRCAFFNTRDANVCAAVVTAKCAGGEAEVLQTLHGFCT